MGDNMICDDDETDTTRADPVECAKKGHCFCIQEGGSTCCWCGFFDYDKFKTNKLKGFDKVVKEMVEKFPNESKEILLKYVRVS